MTGGDRKTDQVPSDKINQQFVLGNRVMVGTVNASREHFGMGGKDLALRLEDEGYGPILREAGLSPDVPDEALLVPKAPAGADDEADTADAHDGRHAPVEAAR